MMLTLCMSLALGATQDDAAKLIEICKKIESAENYTFEVLTESEGGSFGRGRGGEDEQEGPPPPVQGMYKKGSPVQLKRGETLAYRENDQMVVKTEEGWRAVENFGGRGDRGDRGGRGGDDGQRGDRPERGGGGERGDRPERGGGEGGERGDRPERGGERGDRPERGGGEGGERGGRGERGDRGRGGFDRGAMTLRMTQLPHEMLKGFADKIEDMRTEEHEGKRIFKGTLTEEGAQGLVMGGRTRGRGGFGGGGGGDMKTEGTFQIVADPGHHQLKVLLQIKISGSFGDRSFERTTTTKVALREIGNTKFEVPSDALAHFEI